MRIALQYIIAKGQDNVWNIFFKTTRHFQQLEGLPEDIIKHAEEFNLGSTGVNVKNFLQIMENMSHPFGPVCAESADGTILCLSVDEIDAPPAIKVAQRFPFPGGAGQRAAAPAALAGQGEPLPACAGRTEMGSSGECSYEAALGGSSGGGEGREMEDGAGGSGLKPAPVR